MYRRKCVIDTKKDTEKTSFTIKGGIEMGNYKVNTYEEACQLIKEKGIIPLAGFIPGHPSLDSVTEKHQWHTGKDTDPWLWRARFPREGFAAYGKFFKKKSVLISPNLFPFVRAIIGDDRSMEERYESGLASLSDVKIYQAIQEAGEIETRALRAKVGMKAKENKKEFDQSLLHLQGTLDIVISGVQERLNEKGEVNGWNSTSFVITDQWLAQKRIYQPVISSSEAKEELLRYFEQVCSEEALDYFKKLLQLKGE